MARTVYCATPSCAYASTHQTAMTTFKQNTMYVSRGNEPRSLLLQPQNVLDLLLQL